MNTKRQNLIIIVAFVATLSIPWLSYFLGARVPQKLGNTELTDFPSTSPVEMIAPKNIAKTLLALSDRVPLREQVIKQRSRLFYNLAPALHPIPVGMSNSHVILGKNEWLFYHLDFTTDCARSLETHKHYIYSSADFLLNLDRLNKKSFFLIAPDKSNIYREKLTPLQQQLDCWEFKLIKNNFLREGGPYYLGKNFINLWDIFAEQKAANKELYGPGDTHWNSYTHTLVIKELLKRIEPGLFDEKEVITEHNQQISTDLKNNFLLIPGTETASTYYIKRKGISLLKQSERNIGKAKYLHFKHQSNNPESKLIRGRTLLIHDSFFDGFRRDQLIQYFSNVKTIHANDLTQNMPKAWRLVENSNRIIVEMVERDAWLYMSSINQSLLSHK